MRQHSPTIVFIIIAVAGWFLIRGFQPAEHGAHKPTLMTAADTKGLDLTTEMNKLVITLASLVLAGVGKLVVSEGKDGRRPVDLNGLSVRMLLAATVLLAMSALYFSYFVYDKLVEMLAAGFLDLNSDLILSPRTAQVDCLLAAVFTLGLAVISSLARETHK
jgi:hypothetical protein